MRPIDADALLSKIKENDYLLYDRLTDTTKPGMFTLGIEYAIRTAPTIIEAEGKAGRWIVQINMPTAEPEIKPIEYRDCANAMLRMWMDNVVTDGEYNRIMDKLNAYWGMKNGRFN